jgi:hypothetical protein
LLSQDTFDVDYLFFVLYGKFTTNIQKVDDLALLFKGGILQPLPDLCTECFDICNLFISEDFGLKMGGNVSLCVLAPRTYQLADGVTALRLIGRCELWYFAPPAQEVAGLSKGGLDTAVATSCAAAVV